jgi:hypothetical protein
MNRPPPKDVIARALIPGMNDEPMYVGSEGARFILQHLDEAGYEIVPVDKPAKAKRRAPDRTGYRRH